MLRYLGVAAGVWVGLIGLAGRGAASEPPADREVLRAVPVARGVPFLFEQFRDDVTIVKERIAAREVRLPLPAGASVTFAVEHWRCGMNYTETVESAYPFPFKASKKRAEVVYIDTVDVVK